MVRTLLRMGGPRPIAKNAPPIAKKAPLIDKRSPLTSRGSLPIGKNVPPVEKRFPLAMRSARFTQRSQFTSRSRQPFLLKISLFTEKLPHFSSSFLGGSAN